MNKQPPKGIAMLLTVIVVGVTGFSVMAFIARSGIASLRTSQYQESGLILQSQVDGCIDEVIAQHIIDPEFSEGSVSLGVNTCTINVMESGPVQKILDLSVTDGISTKSIEITIGLDPISLISIN